MNIKKMIELKALGDRLNASQAILTAERNILTRLIMKEIDGPIKFASGELSVAQEGNWYNIASLEYKDDNILFTEYESGGISDINLIDHIKLKDDPVLYNKETFLDLLCKLIQVNYSYMD